MTQDELKKQVADYSTQFIKEESIVGVGSGSTVKYFIEALGKMRNKIEGAVASSDQTEQLLKENGIPVFDLNAVNQVSVYVDGADEVDNYFCLIKGRGGALTREKIIASASRQFICIIDKSKKVDRLGSHEPIPLEVIPMARSYVGRQVVKLGGSPVYRENFRTDNGNIILDVHNLPISEPLKLEISLKSIPGVVENGLFAHRTADMVLMSTENGVERLSRA